MTSYLSVFTGKSESEILSKMPYINDDILNTIESDKYTALDWAINEEYDVLSKQLIIRLSDKVLNHKTKTGKTHLYRACEFLNETILIYLLDVLSNENITNFCNDLDVIICIFDYNMTDIILKIIPPNAPMTKIKVDSFNKIHDDTTILLLMCEKYDNEDTVIEVVSKMSDEYINFTNEDGENALNIAYKRGFNKLVDVLEPIMEKHLLSQGNIFYSACKYGFVNIADKHLSSHNINYIDEQGNNVLHYAIMNEMTDIVVKIMNLIDQYKLYDIYSKINKKGETILLCLYQTEMTNLINRVIPHMTNKLLHHFDNSNCNVLHYAIDEKDNNIIDKLISKINGYDIVDVLKMYSENHKLAIEKFGPIDKLNFGNINFYYVLRMIELRKFSGKILKVLPDNILNSVDISGNTILTAHNKLDLQENILHLLTNDTINYVSENGHCALNIALNSNSNSNQLIHKILKKANKTVLNVKDDDNYTPLMQLLIDSEITINSLNDEQQIIRCIDLMSDDTLNTIGYDDKTALHFACEGGYETIGLKLAQRMSKNAINHYCMNSYDDNDSLILDQHVHYLKY